MTSYSEISESLKASLNLTMPPIAVCITDSIPNGVSAFQGKVPGGCVFWQEAAQGAFATSTLDHEMCAVGVHTHHMATPSPDYPNELQAVLKVMADMDYVREDDVPRIPVLEKESKHVIYAPLAASPLPPDAVLLFVHSQQGLIITEAIQQLDPGIPPAMGRPACAIIPQTINTGQAALSLGCCGARAYLDALTDDIALWAFPGNKIQQYAERIISLSKANKTLSQFHLLRRQDIEAGQLPTYQESLARLSG